MHIHHTKPLVFHCVMALVEWHEDFLHSIFIYFAHWHDQWHNERKKENVAAPWSSTRLWQCSVIKCNIIMLEVVHCLFVFKIRPVGSFPFFFCAWWQKRLQLLKHFIILNTHRTTDSVKYSNFMLNNRTHVLWSLSPYKDEAYVQSTNMYLVL
jgi:hypothetical protein